AIPLFVVITLRIAVVPLLLQLAWALPFALVMAAGNMAYDQRPCCLFGNLAVSAGMVSGGVIVMKACLAVMAALLLLQLTGFQELVLALRRLGVPQVLTMQLSLLYRYLFLLRQEVGQLVKARDLRTFVRKGRSLHVTASLLNTLLARASERSQKIYQAMLARGFHGAFPAAQPAFFTWKDAAFVLVFFLVSTGLRIYF
ncbi:cobalt ABC transporter, partial [candidate division FCPU426 bacterium]|nr:cobalt ABC transporter [candidate division FCPU426 bacterium]